MKDAEDLTYSKALNELREIVSNIESQEIDIDHLTQKVRRATELIGFCRSRLRTTEEEIQRIFEDKNLSDIE
ncbi:MAG: exodeoxyribonuclease VII small subunit [Thermodesulfovibrionales bacterium]|nr:exodeoxyribonuclease VII small subunit [Thermodesulfovibrionales bacterium]